MNVIAEKNGGTRLNPTADQIAELLDYFAPHCEDKSTLGQLRAIALNPKRWSKCYSLFERIRTKTIRADRRDDEFHQHQYLFEEICAKTLYNMSVHPDDYAFANPAPFDDDSSQYVFPIAVGFADYLKIPHFDPNQIATSNSQPTKPAITNPCTEARLARFLKWMRGWFGLGDGVVIREASTRN